MNWKKNSMRNNELWNIWEGVKHFGLKTRKIDLTDSYVSLESFDYF